LGIAERVRFLGERHDARRLLPAFDIYVNSSTSEGISLTILEAMAAGVAVVATSVGGTPEILSDGETGLLVPARNPARLSRALATLAAAPVRRRQMGSAGRKTVTDRFTMDRMVEEYAQLYLRLAR
jgi:glycosyltransferase involved in cell wall biosynthesis